ncbi:hypothetical protein EDC38_1248 [Marinimicrobium koreense]|uniref:Uncharacterized protein n=1 Tax=Marinimicrobium koreense TaxID=306545 RepID=A0A3N1NWR1_9GAMM|nr:hypothetical protein [Marinimicrobium koreense]ROQ20635.1 hypothetical protein EDC38_1248 [Marinimicrobium koreense]
MADIHIADFYKDAARILVQLYNQFPRPTMLFVEDIAGPDTPDEFGLHSPRHQSCLSTMLWLAQTGYLRYETLVRQEAIDQAVLTQRGFTLLASPLPVHDVVGFEALPHDSDAPDSDTNPSDDVQAAARADNGVQLLRDVLKHGSSTAIEQVMLELFRQSRHHP